MYVIGSQRELPSLLLMMIGFIIIIVSYRIASYHLLPLSRSLSPSLSLCLAMTTAFNNNRAHLCAMLSRTRRRRLKKFKRITNFSAHLPPLLAPAPPSSFSPFPLSHSRSHSRGIVCKKFSLALGKRNAFKLSNKAPANTILLQPPLPPSTIPLLIWINIYLYIYMYIFYSWRRGCT